MPARAVGVAGGSTRLTGGAAARPGESPQGWHPTHPEPLLSGMA